MKKLAVAIALLLAILMLAPLALTVSASFKGRAEGIGAPLRVIPRRPTLDNYRQLFNYVPVVSTMDRVDARRYNYPIGRWFLNTVIIAVFGAVTTVGSGLLVAFGIAKYRFRGREIVTALIVLSIIVPGQVVFVQRFIVSRWLGLYNNLWAAIVPGAVSSGTVWFLVQYMKSIPDDFLNMGRLDGLGAMGLLRYVVAPLCAPAIAALMAMYLVGVWNDYLWPLVVLRKPDLYTLALGVREVIVQDTIMNNTEQNPGLGFAGAVLAMAPGLVLFLVWGRYFIDGMFAKAGGK